MKKVFLITFLSFTAILVTVSPAVTFAGGTGSVGIGTTAPSETQPYIDAFVPCGTDDVNKDNKVENPCGAGDVIELGRRLITAWIMAGVTFAAIGFAYAGLLYITAMGSQEKISHAHSIFVKTFWGFVFMLSAWLIVKTLEGVFLSDVLNDKSFLYVPSETDPAGGADPKVDPAGGS